jgi:hypothetical protein
MKTILKVGDWVQSIHDENIIFQIKEFHCAGVIIHNGRFIEERILKAYNKDDVKND